LLPRQLSITRGASARTELSLPRILGVQQKMDFTYFASLFLSGLIALVACSLLRPSHLLPNTLLALGAFWLTFSLTLAVVHYRECALLRYYVRKSRLVKRVKRAARRLRPRHEFP
jgi:hypothetical protein